MAQASYWSLVCFVGLVHGDNSTIDNISALTSTGTATSLSWGEWTAWSKWSSCTRSCGGGLSRQQRRCKRKPCKGKSSVKFKICNNQPCDILNDYRAEQCSAFDNIPYSGQLLKWYVHHDPSRPCSLTCRGVSMDSSSFTSSSTSPRNDHHGKVIVHDDIQNKLDMNVDSIDEDSLVELDTDDTIVVQLADKVEDGTKCHADGMDVCIGGTCMIVGCDMRVGSGKTKDVCGVCGGNGSSCQARYSWSLESISACSKSCGGGFKMAMAICKPLNDDSVTDDTNCDADERPAKTLVPCNTHPCSTKWITVEWSRCTASCGGGSRTRLVFCTEKNGNETIKLPDHRCNLSHKPKNQENCNTISCPMWESEQWSKCSATCGSGFRTRIVECRDGNGRLSTNCDASERPQEKQECNTNNACQSYSEESSQSLMQPYPAPPMPEKLVDQPIPSESTFIAGEWSTCSATCGEGIRHRDVHCKIFLEFSKTIARLPDLQCAGPKPPGTEKCMIRPCGLMDNSLSYRIDTVGDSGYEESNLMDSYRSSGSGATDYEGGVKVAPGNSGQTTYSWKESGYSACTASCLGGVQDLIINCVSDDTGKTVMPLLCTKETKPESRVRTCNDHACTPRWNYSDFSPCNSPCGIGIRTRDVMCIHEVARGPGNTVVVPNHMCQTPPPVDRQHCNVLDCPPKWQPGEWDKCSKSCGGGIKRREVICEQVMAQGHKQSRPDRECQGNKPPTEKPCNTKACHEFGSSVQATIFSENITFSQQNPEQKVDLKIGGTATVFQGIPVVKIRCPVKKFNKAQILWTKDRAELHKSRKYKISRKGALKINDIGFTDSGIYACIAGQTHAESRLIIKHRTREQMSSEEILRFGNTVHQRQDVNVDSGSANSGENLQIDRAAPAYQGTFAFGNDDQSHETRPEAPSFGQTTTTKKPRRKSKPKPSPASSGSNPNGEYTVTSIHQPGHHESVESSASSGASRLVPQFSNLITTLKSYLPFQNDAGSNRGHRMVPNTPASDHHSGISRTIHLNEQNDNELHYESGADGFEMFGRNSVIPDDTFGPDEERIFIDDDPYDLETAIISINPWGDVKKSTESIGNRYKPTVTTEHTRDYLEESLKNAKRHRKGSTENYLRNQRGTGKDSNMKRKSKEGIRKNYTTTETSTVVFFLDNSDHDRQISDSLDTKLNKINIEDMKERKIIDEGDNVLTKSTSAIPTTIEDDKFIKELTNSSLHISTNSLIDDTTKSITDFLATNSPDDDEKMFDSGSEMEQIEDSYEEELSRQKMNNKNNLGKLSTDRSKIDDSEINSSNENAHEMDSASVDRGALEVQSNEDTKIVLPPTHPKHLKNKHHSHGADKHKHSLESTINVEIFDTNSSTTTEYSHNNSTLNIFNKNSIDELIYEWITTEWSKCSQTCGGGGFQMRGAQCTVRTTKSSNNTEQVTISAATQSRTVIGASLCEDAGYPVPQKVRPCGIGICPQWHASEWTPCESSRCFNWKTAMQKRDISCRITDENVDGTTNITILEANKCDDGIRPPQRQECYNDACKGVWRVGEWSECTAACEEDGIKYRILQCVWFGTKKPAGNACRDIPRPPVMKTCKGLTCPRGPGECEDHSPLCSRVKMMNMCRVPLYQKQCCKSCR